MSVCIVTNTASTLQICVSFVLLQEKISHVKGKMGASGREFDDRNRNMKEVVVSAQSSFALDLDTLFKTCI